MVQVFKSALVLGLGTSGEAAAELLRGEECRVTVVDAAVSAELRERAGRLADQGVRVLLECRELPDAAEFDVCIVSPGIAAAGTWVRAVEAKGTPVISELALGASHCACPMVAVTGTKGKSTLVKLCAEMLQLAGCRVAPGGNYGVPLCRLAERSAQLDWLVVEVSSFQMERPGRFHPRIAVLLNIQPDHLDRHGDMASYAASKKEIFAQLRRNDAAIVPLGLKQDDAALGDAAGTCRTFGTDGAADYVYGLGAVRATGSGKPYELSGTIFDNAILGQAAAAAVAVAEACRVDPAHLVAAARGFVPLPHRMQTVATVDGVRYVNDSKATNLTALGAALTMADRPVHLIAGGLLKEKNLTNVKELLASRVRRVYLIGRAAEDMRAAWSDVVPCSKCETLDRALEAARREVRHGDMVLLAPGCASFDQFRNYEQRGDTFIRIVRSYYEDGQEE